MKARVPAKPQSKAHSRRSVRRGAALGAVVLTIAVLFAAACAQKNLLAGPGDECFAASDCEPGLVCVPQRGGSRLCSADLSQVTGRPPAEAGMAEAGDAANDGPVADGPQQDGGSDTGVDTGIVDAGDAG